MERNPELYPRPLPEIYSIKLEPRYYYSELDTDEPSGGTLSFGNSGIKIGFSSNRGANLHFTPDYHNSAPGGEHGVVQAKKSKFSKMFGAGMLALTNYFSDLDLSSLEAKQRFIIEKGGGYQILKFYTNEQMLKFAQNVLGEKYFVLEARNTELAEAEGLNMKYTNFLLKDFLEDAKGNPGLLENLNKLGNPQNLKELKSTQE